MAIDGKAQRGRLAFTADGPVHLLSAFCHDPGVVLGQVPITVQEDKPEAELTVPPVLVDQLDWRGRVLTGDAHSCQRALPPGQQRGRGLSAHREGEPAHPA